jgi:hypothetical protein
MKRNLVLTIALLAVLTGKSGAADQTPEVFLQNLYNHEHVPMAKHEIDFSKRASVENYFDKELTDLFVKNAECEEKEQGICNLDFDPIYAAQDFEDKTTDLKVAPVSGQADSFNVTFTNLGTRTLVYKLSKTSKGWRISDIKYPEGPSLKEMLSAEIK